MILNAIPVTKQFAGLEQLNLLNKEAFPRAERFPVEKLVEMAERKLIDFLAVYDQEIFVGFFVIFKNQKCAYLFFLAIDAAQRSKGYGSKVLALIRQRYKNYQNVLDLEEIDPEAENYEQRLTRKKFYIRNGYQETGYYIRYSGVTFEILMLEEQFDSESFEQLLEEMKHIINENLAEKFEPTFFSK